MNDGMKLVASLSLSGALVILVLRAIRSLVQHRFSRRWQYYIWLVAVLRLLTPLSPPESPVGLLFQSAAPEMVQSEPVPSGYSAIREDTERTVQPLEKPAASPAAPSLWNPANLWLIWLAGALGLLVRKVTAYQSFARYVRAGRKAVEDVALLDRLACLGERVGVRRPVELSVNPLVASPLLLGVFRPCIVLATADLPEEELDCVLLHELTHCKRRDILYKWLVQAAVCVHWFNPLVWWMSREIGRACELACDEAVIAPMDEAARRVYGDTLLHAMGVGGDYRNSQASVTLHEGKERLKERLGAIMGFQKMSKLLVTAAFAATALLCAGAAAAGAYRPVPQVDRRSAVILPPALKGEAKASFRYTQEDYYQAPYRFTIGWNVNEKAAALYDSAETALPDGTSLSVLFCDGCRNLPADTETFQALTAVLGRLWTEAQETGFPLLRPLVIDVQNTGGLEAAALAEQCYEAEDMAGFLAVFPQLDETAQRDYLDRCYRDRRMAFFAASLDRLPAGSPLVEALAEQAYTDGTIAFFSVLVNHMDQERIASWLARASAEERTSFRAMLLNASGKDQELEDWKASMDQQLQDEYAAHGITQSGTDYYYQGQKVHVLLDCNPDDLSCITLAVNPKGTADIRVSRTEDCRIASVAYMAADEVQALLGTMEDDAWEDWEDEWEDLSRLSVEELPEEVQQAIRRCADHTWYLLSHGGQQYIWYSGLTGDYSWKPVRQNNGWQIDFAPLKKQGSGYVLITVPDSVPVSVTYQGAAVALAEG